MIEFSMQCAVITQHILDPDWSEDANFLKQQYKQHLNANEFPPVLGMPMFSIEFISNIKLAHYGSYKSRHSGLYARVCIF